VDSPNGDLTYDPIALSNLAIHGEGEGRIGLMTTLNVGFRAIDTARVSHIVEDLDIVRSDELRPVFNS
jgi:hypothetical protein